MNRAYYDLIAASGAAAVRYIGLVNDAGQELSGGSPAYARRAVTWSAPVAGKISPVADLRFDVPSGANVAGWRGYSLATGGTDYGGAALKREAYADQGEYLLRAAGTAIEHNRGT